MLQFSALVHIKCEYLSVVVLKILAHDISHIDSVMSVFLPSGYNSINYTADDK